MTLGIMQPYFFPYLGYFSLMKHTDEWIFFDTPQYIRKGWVNRNRVLKKNGGIKYVRINVKKQPQDTSIKDVLIDKPDQIFNNIERNLDFYKEHHAPYYEETISFLKRCTESFSGEFLSDFLVHSMKKTCEHLGVTLQSAVFSEMDIKSRVEGAASAAGDWALLISKEVGADHYVNPPGGKGIFNVEDFEKHNIGLSFLRHNLSPYRQVGDVFESGLSIIDALMFNRHEEVEAMLDDYVIEGM